VKLTAKEIRSNLKKYLDLVDNGESVHFTRKDKEYTIQSVHRPTGVFTKKRIADIYNPLNILPISSYGCGFLRQPEKLCKKHGRS